MVTATMRRVARLPWLLLCLLTLAASVSSIQIISSSPHSSTVVPEGSNITLSCSSSVPWFFCLWNSPRNEKQCAIQEDEVRGVCSRATSSSSPLGSVAAAAPVDEDDSDDDTHLSVYKLSGARHQCSLFVDRVTRHMHGDWMCLLNEISQFNSVKHTVQLKVGVATHLSWAVVREGGAAAGQVAAEVLQLTEGDRVSIACVAAPGYPVMQFGWEHRILQQEQNTTRARVGREYQDRRWSGGGESGALNNTRKAVYSLASGSHLYSGSQTVDYVANLTHNASVLICQTNQRVDEMEEGEPMFSNTIALTLHISPIVIISSNTHLHERLGVISGIILAIIFIILIFILLSIFLTRRRKADKKYSSLTDKSADTELLKPIWVPGGGGRGARVQVGAAKEYVNEYQQFGEGRELSDCGPAPAGKQRVRGREGAPSQDTNLRHSHSHDHHDPRHLERMVYVKQAGSSSPEYANISVVAAGDKYPGHHTRHVDTFPGHTRHGDTCPGQGRHVVCAVREEAGAGDAVLDISVETHSEHSSTEHSKGTASRPTTRTTKTISDGSDSSRSSVLLEKAGLGGLGRAADTSGDNVDSFLRGEHGHHTVESYISFQSDIRDHSDAIYSPNSTLASDRVSGLATDSDYPDPDPRHDLLHRHGSLPTRSCSQDHHGSCGDSASVSLLHETHFGDSLTDLPRTVISAIPNTDKMSATDLDRITKRYSLVRSGRTIFDCQEGCFISFEEFEKRISQESLNKIQE